MNIVKSESAVSPVIGTILLVAISVILVAIIVTVVMGFANADDGKKVGLNAKPATGNDATLILYDGASIPDLVSLKMIDHDSPIGEYVEFWNITDDSAFVGVPYLVENVARPVYTAVVYDTRINVLGTFTDGTEVVLLIQPMTFGNVRGQVSPVAAYFTSITYGGYEILDNFGKTLLGTRYIQESEGTAYTMGDQVHSPQGLVIALASDRPDDFQSWKVTIESQHPGRVSEFWAYGSDAQKGYREETGTSSAGRTGYAIGSGAPYTKGGTWLFTVTVYRKDGSSVSDSLTLYLDSE